MELRKLRATVAIAAAAALLLTLVMVTPAGAAKPLGKFQFAAKTFEITEGDFYNTYGITRTSATGSASVTVTTGGTAVAGTDYTIANETIVFGDGDTRESVGVYVLVDQEPGEGDETITLKLTSPSEGWRTGKPSTAVLTIHEMPLLPAPEYMYATAGTCGVNLSWSWVSSIYPPVSYRLDRATDPASGWTTLGADPSITNFSDTTISSGETYYYRAAAVNSDGGLGAWSTPQEPVVAPTVPVPPAPTFSQALLYDDGVDLGWNLPSTYTCPVTYEVWRSGGDTPLTTFELVASGLQSTVYYDYEVEPGYEYAYRVRAVNSAAGPGSYSSDITPIPAGPS